MEVGDNMKESLDRALEIDDSIFGLFSEGILTFQQSNNCYKKLWKWCIKRKLDYYRKFRQDYHV